MEVNSDTGRMDECFVQLPILKTVSASKTKQSRFFREIAAHLPGARKDGLGKKDSSLNRDLTLRFTYLSGNNSVIVTGISNIDAGTSDLQFWTIALRTERFYAKNSSCLG
jgi:hypothetical protein